jgi:ribonucleotide monophosphatase NagD (HAD superfamily)
MRRSAAVYYAASRTARSTTWRSRIARARRSVRSGGDCRNGVLAIGDRCTDLKGAHDLGVDCPFVTAGIHAPRSSATVTIRPSRRSARCFGRRQAPKP